MYTFSKELETFKRRTALAKNSSTVLKAPVWGNSQGNLKDKLPYVSDLKDWFLPVEDLSQVVRKGTQSVVGIQALIKQLLS